MLFLDDAETQKRERGLEVTESVTQDVSRPDPIFEYCLIRVAPQKFDVSMGLNFRAVRWR